MTRHHLSGGAQGPDPVQALLQAGPPDAVQPPPAAEGTRWCLVAADAGRAVLRRIAAKSANVVLLNIFIYLLVELRGLNPLVQRWPTQDENAKNSQLFPSLNQVDALGRRQLSTSSQPQDWNKA
jgi:hypothetical protein